MSDPSGSSPMPGSRHPGGSLGKRPAVQGPELAHSQHSEEGHTQQEATPLLDDAEHRLQVPSTPHQHGNASTTPHFPALYVTDPRTLISDDSVSTICRNFMNPTKGYFSEEGDKVKLTLTYAIGKLGLENFEYKDVEAGTRVLRANSIFRVEGNETLLPQEIMDWLFGDPIAEMCEFKARLFTGESG